MAHTLKTGPGGVELSGAGLDADAVNTEKAPLFSPGTRGQTQRKATSAHVSRSRDIKALYTKHHATLVKYLRKTYGAGPPEPEEVAHKAFAKLNELEDLSRIRNLPGFLWRTARNVLISEKRALAVREKGAADVEATIYASSSYAFDPERVLLAKEQIAVVERALMGMSERRRQILLMSRIEGLNNAEIGRRLGIARPAVSKHLSLALRDINAALQHKN